MSESKRTKVVGIAAGGISTYCGACLRRLNKGLVKNGLPPIEGKPCYRGTGFPCFGCGHLFDGAVVKEEE